MDEEVWITATEAVALVKSRSKTKDDDVAQDRLIRWAADSNVRTRCVRWVQRPEVGEPRSFDNIDMDPDFWNAMERGAVIAEWEYGEFSAKVYQSPFGSTETRVHGVEFNADDIGHHLAMTLMGRPPTPRQSPDPSLSHNAHRPADPVRQSEIEAWHATLTPPEKSMGLRWLHERARQDHPGRKVVRKLIEPFVYGRARGRPPGR